MNPGGELRVWFLKALLLENSDIRISLIFSNRNHNLPVIIYWYFFLHFSTKDFFFLILMLLTDKCQELWNKMWQMISFTRKILRGKILCFIYVKGDITSVLFFLSFLAMLLILLNNIQTYLDCCSKMTKISFSSNFV